MGKKFVDSMTTGQFIRTAVPSVLLFLLYFPVFLKLSEHLSVKVDELYLFLVPFLSAWMVYSIRGALAAITDRPSNWGLMLLLAGLVLLLVGRGSTTYFLERISIIPVLGGLALFVKGPNYLKKVLFPVLFLALMVPLPSIIRNQIAYPMQLFTAWLTEQCILMIGDITIYRLEKILFLADGVLEVVPDYSPLRPLHVFLTASGAVTWFVGFAPLRQWALISFSIPVAILSSGVGMTGGVLLAHHYGEKTALEFLNNYVEVATLFLGFSMLLVATVILRGKVEKNIGNPDVSSGSVNG